MSEGTTRYPEFRAAGLLQMASMATGLADFGPETFRAGLERLLDSVNGLRLTDLGVLRARNAVLGNLAARLGVWDHRKRHPQLAEEEIRSPIFVIGLPRTGTTLLFGLLAQDPDHRAPLLWETSMPCPPPEAAGYETDPRIALVTESLKQVDGLNPKVLAVHPIGARLPQECIGIFSMEFLSYIFYCGLPIRGYNDWLDEQDVSPAYRWHRLFLQHLQSRHRRKRWVLKAPSHMAFMGHLFETYPDALIINTHRSPVTAVASHASLHWHLWEQSLGRFDPKEVGPQTADMLERWLRRFVAWRNAHPGHEARIADVVYADLVSDPIGTVHSIYRRFDLPVTPVFEQRMRAFLAENRQDRHGTHHYLPEEFGLEEQALRERFRFYVERFDVHDHDR